MTFAENILRQDAKYSLDHQYLPGHEGSAGICAEPDAFHPSLAQPANRNPVIAGRATAHAIETTSM